MTQVAVVASGCSLVGMGIGAMIPTYTAAPAAEVVEGADVRVRRRDIAGEASTDLTLPPAPSVPSWAAGRYEGLRDGRLVVETCDGTQTVALSDVRKIEVRDGGTSWKIGLLVGALADVFVVTVVLAIAATSSYSPSLPGYAFSLR